LTSEIPSLKKIWAIAWPIIISLLAQNVVGVTDTAFLGRVSEAALGGAAIGGLFYIILFMVGHGFTTGVQILVARRFGEKKPEEIGRIFDNSIYFLALTSVVVTAFIYFLGPAILKHIVVSQAVLAEASVYLSYRVFGLFFAMMGLVYRAFYTGITYTRYLSITSVIMAVVNIGLDYLLIFGKAGFPEMGIAGAAIASAISELCSLVFFVIVTQRTDRVKPYNLFRLKKPDFSLIKSTLGVSVFIMIQFVLSLSVWFVFFLIIEKMGERPLAISNIARSVYMFLMIPGWALCSVTNTLVSNVLGEEKPSLVLPITFRILKFSMIILASIILLAALVPKAVLGVFTNDVGLVQAAIPTYYIILTALFLFSLMSILFNAVLGTANTRITLLIEIITLSFYVFYTWLIAIRLRQPVEIAWTAEWVYAFSLGILSYSYLKWGKWQTKSI
jgi:putative MATE family efflux protein